MAKIVLGCTRTRAGSTYICIRRQESFRGWSIDTRGCWVRIGPPVYCDRRPAPCCWHKARIGPYHMGRGIGSAYCESRLRTQLARFRLLAGALRSGRIQDQQLIAPERMDNLFPDLDPRHFGDLEFFQGGFLYSGKISSLEFSLCAKSKCDSGAALLKRRGETWKQRLIRGFPISRSGAIRYGLYVASLRHCVNYSSQLIGQSVCDTVIIQDLLLRSRL